MGTAFSIVETTGVLILVMLLQNRLVFVPELYDSKTPSLLDMTYVIIMLARLGTAPSD